jgi:hypothetical protein
MMMFFFFTPKKHQSKREAPCQNIVGLNLDKNHRVLKLHSCGPLELQGREQAVQIERLILKPL